MSAIQYVFIVTTIPASNASQLNCGTTVGAAASMANHRINCFMSSTSLPPILQAHDVARQVVYGGETLTILRGVNMTVNTGETVAIVGSSGSGKSTLLGILAGLDHPSDGQVVVFGKSLSLLDEDERAKLRQRLVGFVFQSFQLLPALTAALIKSDHEVGKVIVSRPVAPLHPAEVEFESFIAAHGPMAKPAATGPDDPGFWLYSSGSTAKPKPGSR